MRSLARARWAGSALALVSILVSSPAGADKDVKKSKVAISECASFQQKDAGDSAVDFTVDNACSIKVECTVTWSITCAPDSRKKRSKKFEGQSFALDAMQSKTTTASADRCGDDGWAIDDVSWSCAPAKD